MSGHELLIVVLAHRISESVALGAASADDAEHH